MPKRISKEEQIIAILREAEKGERPIGDLCRAHGSAENTFYIRPKGTRPQLYDAVRVWSAVAARAKS